MSNPRVYPARHDRTPAPADAAVPPQLAAALARFARGLDGGRPFTAAAHDRLAQLLKRHGPTVHAGRLYYVNGASEVYRRLHVSGRARPRAAGPAYYDAGSGKWV